MNSPTAELSVTQPGHVSRATILARRMAAAYYRTLFGAAPTQVADADGAPAHSMAGEVVVAHASHGDCNVLICIRAAGGAPDARWWNAVVAAETLAAAHDPGGVAGSFVAFPRATLGTGATVCATAYGTEGSVRVLTLRGGIPSGLCVPPLADEELRLVVPTTPPSGHSSCWISEDSSLLLYASGDYFRAVLRHEDPLTPEIVVSTTTPAPACGFRFRVRVRTGGTPSVYRVDEVSGGIGFGDAAGATAELAIANGALLLRSDADGDATTILEPE